MKDLLMKTGKDRLNQQMSAYGLDNVSKVLRGGAALSESGLSRYQLVIDGVSASLSVLSVQGYEHLSEPWRYQVQFTAQHGLTMQQILSEKATFTLAENGINSLGSAAGQLSDALTSAFSVFGDMLGVGENRVLHGVVTAFSQLATSTDEAHYSITLSPRLALLDNAQNSAIFQHRTVPQVVEQVLRQHDMTGVDFRFELTESYPVKEYISQWQESDLSFIRRLLADSGIWFRFETHTKHACDVVVFGDGEQQYQDGPTASYRQPSGNNDNGVESVWDMSVDRKTVPQSVLTQDYNYRNAQTGMKSDVNGAQKDKTTRGRHYVYGEHYRDKGEVTHHANAQDELVGQFSNMIPAGLGDVPGVGGTLSGLSDKNLGLRNGLSSNESENASEEAANHEPDNVGQGAWYARLRHQRFMTEQITIRGKTTLSHLAPGQILTVSGSPIAEAGSGILIVSVETQGDRQQAYVISFTGIPYDVLRPYRPARLPWPTISGTLPARVTSPDNDTYSYIDVQGRYRVKMDFDLNDNWRKGEESLWMRLAKSYAGETYGIHFPLIDGTEVAIAFTEGNPDRPYIAHAMHDSRHGDVVTLANHKRNLIRTPANNKLRMDDERGKEHIKLATEYGKTQLNMGHLVDAERKPRGEGFELRTDEWGAIRAAKGIQISTEPQERAQGQQRDMSGIIKQLEEALMLARGLAGAAEVAGAVTSELDSQQALQTTINNLNASGLALYGQEGIAQLTPKSQQISAGDNVMITSGQDVAVSAFKKFTLAAGDMLSLFAQKLGIKLIAASGRVQIQAQNDELELTSRKDMFITTLEGKMVIHARKELLLMSGGAGIRIRDGVVEIIAPERILHKSPVLEQPGGASIDEVMPSFQKGDFTRQFRLHVEGNPDRVIANRRFRLHRADGTIEEGISDANGESPLLAMNELEQVQIEILEVVRNV
ncbi:DUF2345 domain-containing protein [Limnobaculum parvum]|uniref:Type VI secretion system tip protein VgrG n=1 Tax=Limnobaculum parvum TaxID=2172103 RepID=A0A2Y9U0G0_9GAMM|nr:type VI secretion system Vgr family protein [Limnobaculum parvum]AWH89425.1 type VI secretion system tip protein VgrG [Limnobaculum parvum]